MVRCTLPPYHPFCSSFSFFLRIGRRFASANSAAPLQIAPSAWGGYVPSLATYLSLASPNFPPPFSTGETPVSKRYCPPHHAPCMELACRGATASFVGRQRWEGCPMVRAPPLAAPAPAHLDALRGTSVARHFSGVGGWVQDSQRGYLATRRVPGLSPTGYHVAMLSCLLPFLTSLTACASFQLSLATVGGTRQLVRCTLPPYHPFCSSFSFFLRIGRRFASANSAAPLQIAPSAWGGYVPSLATYLSLESPNFPPFASGATPSSCREYPRGLPLPSMSAPSRAVPGGRPRPPPDQPAYAHAVILAGRADLV